jgi:hypothetical protein
VGAKMSGISLNDENRWGELLLQYFDTSSSQHSAAHFKHDVKVHGRMESSLVWNPAKCSKEGKQ